MKDFNFIIPTPILKGDRRVVISGKVPPVDCRVISEYQYQYLMDCRSNAFVMLDALNETISFLSHIQPKIGEQAFNEIYNTVLEAAKKATS